MSYRVPGRLLFIVVAAVATTLPVRIAGRPAQTLDDVLARAAKVADSTLRVVCQEATRQTIVVDPVPRPAAYEAYSEPAHTPTEWGFRDVVAGWSIAPPSRNDGEGWKELRKVQSVARFQTFPGKRAIDPRTTALIEALDVPAPFPRLAQTFLSASSQSRFEFSKAGETEVGGLRVWEVTFRETATPPAWGLPLSGSLWLDPSTGHVVRSAIAIKGADAFADTMTVDYRVDPTTALNLPHALTRRTHLNPYMVDRLWVDTTGTFTACRVLPAATN